MGMGLADDRQSDAIGGNRQAMADWNARQQRVAVLLASGSTIRDAAAESSVGERTIHTWLDDPAFRAFVSALRDRLLNETIGRLTLAASRAASVLETLLDSEQDQIRLRAASSILDAMIRVREHGELANRVAELESRAGAESPQR
jgi:hypothetical protein